jgi:hypothetical protein
MGIFFKPEMSRQVVSPILAVEKTGKVERTPWQILESDDPKDQLIARFVRSSFKPSFYTYDRYVVPLSLSQEFVCSPAAPHEGEPERPAIWLDPRKWTEAKDEFLQFVCVFDDRSQDLRFLVTRHGLGQIGESISMKPVIIKPSGECHESAMSYTLTPDGQVDLGDEAGFFDLGILNPTRILEKEYRSTLLTFQTICGK